MTVRNLKYKLKYTWKRIYEYIFRLLGEYVVLPFPVLNTPTCYIIRVKKQSKLESVCTNFNVGLCRLFNIM